MRRRTNLLPGATARSPSHRRSVRPSCFPPTLPPPLPLQVILNEINVAPVLSQCGVTRTVVEKSPIGTVVSGVPIAYSDVNTKQGVMLAITAPVPTSSIPFTVGLCDGVLKVSSATLDYAVQTSYTFTITATDTGTPPLSTTCSVTVNVLDFNDPPRLTVTTFLVPENVPAGYAIGNVAATDPDAADLARLTYAVARADSPDHITIDATGLLKVKAANTINYEAKSSYLYSIQVSDGVNTVLTNVLVNVQDQNDAPYWGAGVATVTLMVPENSGAGVVLTLPNGAAGGLAATDEDRDAITYSTSLSSVFSVAPATGVVSVAAGANLDFETTPSYSGTATATDARGAATSVTFVVTLKDMNEIPTFTGGVTQARSVNENAGSGTPVGAPISATDVDAGQVLSYSLYSATPNTQAGLWTVDGLTGQIRVGSGVLDFEPGPRSYSIVVAVTDSGNPALTVRSTVTVSINDVNEPPTFTAASFTRSVNENSAVGTAVGAAIPATDPEGSAVTYSLQGAAGVFAVGAGGQVTVAQAVLDYESTAQYDITVCCMRACAVAIACAAPRRAAAR